MFAFVVGLVFIVLGFGAVVLRPLFSRSGRIPILGGSAGALFGGLLVVLSFVHSVPAASVGIPTTFGRIGGDLRPGIHWLAPWTTVHDESTRLQTYTMVSQADEGTVRGDDSIAITSRDEAQLPVDLTVTFAVDPTRANRLFRTVGNSGVQLLDNVIRPEARSVIPAVFAGYAATDAATTSRSLIEQQIAARLGPILAAHGVVLDAVQIRNVTLPEAILSAAQQKLQAQQAVAQAQFQQQQAQVEAQTARITAQGKAEANEILARSLTPAIVCQNYIDALGKLTVTTLANPCAGLATGAATGTATGTATGGSVQTSVIVDGRK